MKISDIIKQLEKIMEEKGDVNVLIPDYYDCEFNSNAFIERPVGGIVPIYDRDKH